MGFELEALKTVNLTVGETGRYLYETRHDSKASQNRSRHQTEGFGAQETSKLEIDEPLLSG